MKKAIYALIIGSIIFFSSIPLATAIDIPMRKNSIQEAAIDSTSYYIEICDQSGIRVNRYEIASEDINDVKNLINTYSKKLGNCKNVNEMQYQLNELIDILVSQNILPSSMNYDHFVTLLRSSKSTSPYNDIPVNTVNRFCFLMGSVNAQYIEDNNVVMQLSEIIKNMVDYFRNDRIRTSMITISDLIAFFAVMKPLRFMNSFTLGGGPGINSDGEITTIGLNGYQIFDINYQEITVHGFSGIKIIEKNDSGYSWSTLFGTAITVVE